MADAKRDVISPDTAPYDAMVRAVIVHAERQADLTAAYLDVIGALKSKPARFPAAFLLELAAVLELGLWERRDLRRHLDIELPTYREAMDRLVTRCRKGSAEFDGPNATSLSRQIMQAWIEHFAWDGPNVLNADVVLGEADENEFIDLLAEFVWTHLSELSVLLGDDGNETKTQ